MTHDTGADVICISYNYSLLGTQQLRRAMCLRCLREGGRVSDGSADSSELRPLVSMHANVQQKTANASVLTKKLHEWRSMERTAGLRAPGAGCGICQ